MLALLWIACGLFSLQFLLLFLPQFCKPLACPKDIDIAHDATVQNFLIRSFAIAIRIVKRVFKKAVFIPYDTIDFWAFLRFYPRN